MSDGGECSSGSYSAEGQPLLAAAATVAVLSSSTAATAANLIQDTPPLTGRVREREREREEQTVRREREKQGGWVERRGCSFLVQSRQELCRGGRLGLL